MIGLPLKQTFTHLIEMSDEMGDQCVDVYRRIFDEDNGPGVVPVFPHVIETIKMLKEKFGDYFDDIKTRTGFDLEKIIDVADTRVLERLAHQKEILVESKAFISIPGIERIDISNKYFSLRLLKVDTEKKWDISMYPVRNIKNTNTPVVTGVKKDTDIELHVGRGENALNITLLAGTDAAEAWRLCKRGVVVRNAKGEAYLLTPCRYNHRYANALPVSYVLKRIENIIKHSAKESLKSHRMPSLSFQRARSSRRKPWIRFPSEES